MKVIAIFLMFLLMSPAIGSAIKHLPAQPKAQPEAPPPTAGMEMGTVKNLVKADPQKKVKATLTTTNKRGYDWEFVVGKTTFCYDSRGRRIAFEKIKPSEKVVVTFFLNEEKKKEARVIKILP